MVTSRRIAVLLAVVAVSLVASAQPVDIDYRISFSQGGVPAVGIDVVYALVVDADWSSNEQEPFVVRVTVPRELEASVQCHGDDPAGTVTFDPATRELTWSSRFDNPYLAQKSCPLLFRVAPGVTPGTPFALHATLTTSKADPNPSNDTASIFGAVLATSNLQVHSTTDVERFRPGTTVTYTLMVTNRGPLDAHGVVLEDEFSPHVTFVSFTQTGGPEASLDRAPSGNFIGARIPTLAAGETATFRLVVTATPSAEAADIVNRVHAHSSSYDPAERDNESIVRAFAGPLADLAITGSRGAETLARRTPIALQVSNYGPDAVHQVTVTNDLGPATPYGDPAYDTAFVSITLSQGACGTPQLRYRYIDHYPHYYWSLDCSLGTLAPGATATIAVVVARGASAGPVQYSASVGPGQNDPHPENNQTPLTPAGRRRSARK